MRRAETSLARWGTSLAVRIPKAIAEAAELKAGDALEIDLQDGVLIIQPMGSKPTLEQLLERITPENCHPATTWGPAVGNEVW